MKLGTSISAETLRFSLLVMLILMLVEAFSLRGQSRYFKQDVAMDLSTLQCDRIEPGKSMSTGVIPKKAQA
jgi:hypothetical protein